MDRKMGDGQQQRGSSNFCKLLDQGARRKLYCVLKDTCCYDANKGVLVYAHEKATKTHFDNQVMQEGFCDIAHKTWKKFSNIIY